MSPNARVSSVWTPQKGLSAASGSIAIVPNKPEKSELYFRITSDHPAEDAPPEDWQAPHPRKFKKSRPGSNKGGISETWAFIPPVRPEIPKVRGPDGSRTRSISSSVARLEEEGLKLSPEADRTALIRRLSLDLSGLPPPSPRSTPFWPTAIAGV